MRYVSLLHKLASNAGHYGGRIKSRHLDFLIANKETGEPILAVELDGSSHDHPSRQKADRFLNEALTSAGLPLSRIRVGSTFKTEVAALTKYLG